MGSSKWGFRVKFGDPLGQFRVVFFVGLVTVSRVTIVISPLIFETEQVHLAAWEDALRGELVDRPCCLRESVLSKAYIHKACYRTTETLRRRRSQPHKQLRQQQNQHCSKPKSVDIS